MNMQALKFPVISLIIVGMVHLIAEAIFPDLQKLFQPDVVGMVVFAFGIWTGYKTVQSGGGYVQALVAGAVLGLLPLLLDIIGFGMLLGRGVTAGMLAGTFGWAMVFFGSVVGGGFASSK